MIHMQSGDILTAQVIHSSLFRIGQCLICLHDLHIKEGEKKDIHVTILVFLSRVITFISAKGVTPSIYELMMYFRATS